MGLNIKSFFSVAGILLFIICSASGTAPSVDNNSDIKIGAIYNLEGSQASLDVPSSQGALLAGELFNQKRQDRKVDIIVKDGKSNLSLIAPITQDLINSSHCQVLIGLSDSDMLTPAAEIAAANKIPFLSSGATSPKIPDVVKDYLYLACFGDNAQAAVAAEYAVHNLTAHTAAIYYDGTMNYTTLLGSYFKSRFVALGGEVTQYSAISSGVKDISKEIEILKEKNIPDIIFLAVGPDDAPSAVRLIRESGIQVPIFGGDSYDTKNLSIAANLSGGGVYYTTHAYFGGENQIPEVKTFIEAYKQKYGTVPDAFAGLGYDAVNIVLTAIDLIKDDSNIREGFPLINQYQGVTGLFTYTNSSPIPEKSVTLMQAGDIIPVRIGDFIPEKSPTP
ncbi:MAG: ABC transporter substrate-binding protein [Methanobacteriota archaeon]